MREVIKWLTQKEDWISYLARTDLLDENIDRVLYREKILLEKEFDDIVNELSRWPEKLMKNHKDSGHPVHKLAFLADVGIKSNDGKMPLIIEMIKKHVSEEGVYQVLVNIPTHFGGSGENQLSWMLCDAPTILYSLAKMGLRSDEEVIRGTRYLVGLQDENGWRCKADQSLGGFRGPGKKADVCPYANLLMLKLLSEVNSHEFDEVIPIALEAVLKLWEDRKERKEYLFGMGTDFKKLKAPLIWFDLLHVLDVLSKYELIYDDYRFVEMVDVLRDKINNNKYLTAESVYMPWKSWEFGQKKVPSRFITLIAYRILKRIDS